MDGAESRKVKGNILVVDDDLSTRQTMDAFLTRVGYEVRCAPNGETALMFASEDPPELILLDVRLPDMDGFEVCRRLEEGHIGERVPVIFVSAADETIDKIKGFVAGGVDYITKPFQAEELLARVETHLALKRQQKQIEAQNTQLEQEIVRTRQAQEALQRARDELEVRVKERTAELALANEQLDERLRFESLLAEISGRFVHLPIDRIEDEIKDAQRRICEFLHFDRSTLWLASEKDQETLRLVHIHPAPEGRPSPEGMDARDFFPWSIRKILGGEVVTIPRVADLPPEAARDRETWDLYSTKSAVVVPLSTGGVGPFGAMSFAITYQEQDWSGPIVRGLQLIAQVFADALGRKAAEETLFASEERLSLAADSAGAVFWRMEIPSGEIWTSETFEESVRLTEYGKLTFDYFLTLVHPDDREPVRQAVLRAVQTKEDYNEEYRLGSSGGGFRWMAARGRLRLDNSGNPVYLTGVSIDITEHKRKDEQIKEQYGEIERLKERLQQENIYLQKEIKLLVEHTEIVGESLGMKEVMSQAEQVAGTESTVLILGETGTGKELVARAVHKMSARKDRPLVTVNCASLPPTLIESELFGREKGAYTGAMTKMVGRFEIADGSTLFLDEIGELPLDLQSKLLRVLETGDFERLGSTRTVHVDVRVIAATNRDIARDVTEGKFRKDLFYRLNVFPITIPPLRNRSEDIPLLVWTFVSEFQRKMGKEIESVPKKSMEALQFYSWPGNVRELRNVIERAMIVTRGKTLFVQAPELPSSETPDAHNLEDMERSHIVSVLERNGWRVGGKGGAAEVLGLKRSTLYSKMKKLGIKLNRPTS